MKEKWETKLRRWTKDQSISVPGWIGAIEIAGRAFLIQGWFTAAPGIVGSCRLEFSRRIDSNILLRSCQLAVHEHTSDPTDPDMLGITHIAERDMAVAIWMDRDEHDKRFFRLMVTELLDEGFKGPEAKPISKPLVRRGLRRAPRSRF